MDPSAYEVFPNVVPIPKIQKESNYCILVAKDVGIRRDISYCRCGYCSLLGSNRENVCCAETVFSDCQYSKNFQQYLESAEGQTCICHNEIIRSVVENKLELELFQSYGDYWKSKGGFFVDKNLGQKDPVRLGVPHDNNLSF